MWNTCWGASDLCLAFSHRRLAKRQLASTSCGFKHTDRKRQPEARQLFLVQDVRNRLQVQFYYCTSVNVWLQLQNVNKLTASLWWHVVLIQKYVVQIDKHFELCIWKIRVSTFNLFFKILEKSVKSLFYMNYNVAATDTGPTIKHVGGGL